ncbi:IPT/TIG domain-containing protein [Streptomyces sp. MOE7]|uniref:IPT/TIG domain-containing protein n=1 Tax=Streptomyces sp. MOE7 TaxID=1961713 RepID=UPI0009FBDA7C|nr:IPT/TIG domain-containing protein [Streptomyces sp. MOE7]ARH89905.1 hypothetical protein STRMOE7_05880 [Streptomyces sp. MOE7]
MAPVVTSVSPAQGAPAGGTAVNITGSGFTGATQVRFGPNGTTFVIVSDTLITARTPREPVRCRSRSRHRRAPAPRTCSSPTPRPWLRPSAASAPPRAPRRAAVR